MPIVLTIRYKGYVLKVPIVGEYLYAKKKFYGKTLYQILLEHLIGKKIVNCRELARKYQKVHPGLSPAAIKYIMGKIQSAVKKSPNKRLKKMHFIRMPWGGASPVIRRKSKKSRLTAAHWKVIDQKLTALGRHGKWMTFGEIGKACRDALKKAGLGRNVVLTPKPLQQAMKRLDVSLLPPRGTLLVRRRKGRRGPFLTEQSNVLDKTLIRLHKGDKRPAYGLIRTKFFEALKGAGLPTRNVILNSDTIRKHKVKLNLPVRPHRVIKKPKRRL